MPWAEIDSGAKVYSLDTYTLAYATDVIIRLAQSRPVRYFVTEYAVIHFIETGRCNQRKDR